MTGQVVCMRTVPVCDRDPMEDVCITAGGFLPKSLFHFLMGLGCCEVFVCGTVSESVFGV